MRASLCAVDFTIQPVNTEHINPENANQICPNAQSLLASPPGILSKKENWLKSVYGVTAIPENAVDSGLSVSQSLAQLEFYTQKKCEFDHPFKDQGYKHPTSCSNMSMALPMNDYDRTSVLLDTSFGLQNANEYLNSQSVDSTLSCDTYLNYSKIETSDEKHRENKAIGFSSFDYQCPLNVKPLITLPQRNPMDCHLSPFDMKTPPSLDADKSEDSTRTNSRFKRKKPSENNGCKHCNCRKSKCLKLYCDCFAAGQFCAETCSCQQCLNKPDNEEEVFEAREKIESRNPIAFAPKVIMEHTKKEEDGKHATPTAGRHTRGCNCKKSQCLKNYCECYQAQIGCSPGCRCSSCKNTFGRKEGLGKINEMNHEWDRANYPSDGILEAVELLQCHTYLSPQTPFVQGSNGDDHESQPPVDYYPSPESVASVSPPYMKYWNSIDSLRNSMFTEARETSAPISYGQGNLDTSDILKDNSCPALHGNLDTPNILMDNFSPIQTVEMTSCQSGPPFPPFSPDSDNSRGHGT